MKKERRNTQKVIRKRPSPAERLPSLGRSSRALHWFGSCSAAEWRALEREVKAAQKITASSLPSMEDIYKVRCLKSATNIMKDNAHPAAGLFPSGRRLRSVRPRTTRRRNSFNGLILYLSLGGPEIDTGHYVMVRHCT